MGGVLTLFIAETITGNRINAMEVTDTKEIKVQCKNQEIFCPACKGLLEFRAGKSKVFHFAHKNTCSYPYGEPESERHMNGKLQIASWLTTLYPNSNVEIEWWIEETNQRADVIVIHPSGERWAFEFQCSTIPEAIWRERHELYKAAGIKDFWILNVHFNDWTANERPNIYLKKELERAIFNEYHYVAYLATPYEKDATYEYYMLNIIRGGELEKTITIGSDYFSDALNSIQIIDDHYWNNEMCKYYSKYNRINKLINIPSLYGLVMDFIKEKESQKEKQKREKYNEFYKHLLIQRKKAFNALSFKEKELFLKLCNKHGFSIKTLPGFLMTEGPSAHLIKTPSFVWQLWVYDQFVFNQSYIQRKKDFPSIYIPTLNEKFKELRRRGYLRINAVKDDYGSYYVFAPGDFISLLGSLGFTIQLSRKNSKFHKILLDKFKPCQNITESVLIEWYSANFLSNQYLEHGIPQKVIEAWEDYNNNLT